MSSTLLTLTSMISYDITVVVWLCYFALPVAEQRRSEMLLQPQRWNVSLGELTRPVEPESLMPMFDAMVDRAFSKAGAAAKPVPPTPAACSPREAAEKASPANGTPALTEAVLAAAAHRGS